MYKSILSIGIVHTSIYIPSHIGIGGEFKKNKRNNASRRAPGKLVEVVAILFRKGRYPVRRWGASYVWFCVVSCSNTTGNTLTLVLTNSVLHTTVLLYVRRCNISRKIRKGRHPAPTNSATLEPGRFIYDSKWFLVPILHRF